MTLNKALFYDRRDAGRQLGQALKREPPPNPLVLAIPAGGVPVAAEIARALEAPLDLMIVRKIQIPWNPEAGFGAVTSTGDVILNPRIAPRLGLDQEQIDELVETTREQVAQRERVFRGDSPPPDLGGRSVILVDDGLASGYTMLAAVQSVRRQQPEEIVVAVPTASGSAVTLVEPEVDRLIALYMHPADQPFAVASSYRRWHDLTDQEVLDILRDLRADRATDAGA